jgi:CubicO group peptidase (beta-lactamase class C family)
MKPYSIALLLFLSLFAGIAKAQNNFTPVDKWLDDHTKTMGGRSILMIYKDGKIVHTYAVNELDMRQKMIDRYIAKRQGKTADLDDYTPTMRQPIASCSKWLSAALVMTFVDEGKLRLNDTVGKYLPILSQHGKGNITIKDCLSHLTGVNEPPLREELHEMKDFSIMDDAIAAIAKMPVEGQPGKVFHYSNAGLQIAGAVIEKISGEGFVQLFAERIARPLDMQNTDFGHTKVPLPAGGAYSTPNDYMNFLVMILNKGTFNGKRILSEKSINEMQVNRLTPDVRIAYNPAQMPGFGYGYGEWVMDAGTVSSPGLFGSFPWVNNDQKYCAFLMTYYLNNAGRDERFKELEQLVNTALAKN